MSSPFGHSISLPEAKTQHKAIINFEDIHRLYGLKTPHCTGKSVPGSMEQGLGPRGWPPGLDLLFLVLIFESYYHQRYGKPMRGKENPMDWLFVCWRAGITSDYL
jgi:hypothetical protein